MIRKFNYIVNYLIYFFTSDTKHQIHSPFVFEFVTKVLNARNPRPAYHSIELLRSKMLKSNALITIQPLGANASAGVNVLPLKTVCERTSKSAREAELLERICYYYNPEIAVEIGTSLGISTLYQAVSITNGCLFTFEGNTDSIKVAKHNAEKMELENIQFIEGNFNVMIPAFLAQVPKVDYVFFDGNHTLEATLQYFEWFLTKAHTNTIFVFDDIRWSDDMTLAWKKITKHKAVTISIDLYSIGIVFFRQGKEKQDFTVRF